ncbi:hypothetical protein OF122_13160 [Pelagibacterium flavum]|uniref:Uncharacterized protein n=1 Tax=Pelagibacterium flavum TaxID=2984530 RepID=A0ABY6IKB8_9HYPH|nr:hypothetical protein [Pelagibacterium sp. YIM 151497]UYQ71008.1 hypothetical protein OF122_13160 [Pelagibacterium sp. YIM 151497]
MTDPFLCFFDQKARALSDAGDLEALTALIQEALDGRVNGYGPPTSDINTAIELEQKLIRERKVA